MDHHGAVRLTPVVEQRHDGGVLDTHDPLRCRLEAEDELWIGHDRRVEDAHRHLAPHRRLVGAVHFAEFTHPDQGAQLEARHGSLGTARQQRRQSVELQRRELVAESVTDELIDVHRPVQADDVEPAERARRPPADA